MKRIRAGVASIIALAGMGHVAHAAETYPAKPVRIIVGLAPGGATDIQARWYAQKLTERLGRSFIVDNRTGAGGLLAYQLAANAAPDGYTVVAATASFTIVPAVQPKVPYDTVKDYEPVALVTKAPYLVIVSNSTGPKSVPEMIAFARSKPGALLIAIPGTGTINHLGGAWLSQITNTKITLVPYKGAGPSLAAVLSNEVPVTFANVLSALPMVKTGRVRAIAVTTGERSSALPDLPTVAEGGVPGFDVNTWHGWLAPKGTPRAIVQKLNQELAAVVKSPDLAEKLAEDGAIAIFQTPEQFGKYIADEGARWKSLVKETGLRIN